MRSDVQYLADLYNAVFRRGGDIAGVTFWKGRLASGAMTREQVRAQILEHSREMHTRIALVANAGCLR